MLSDRKSQNLGLRTKKDPTGPTPQQTRAILALLHRSMLDEFLRWLVTMGASLRAMLELCADPQKGEGSSRVAAAGGRAGEQQQQSQGEGEGGGEDYWEEEDYGEEEDLPCYDSGSESDDEAAGSSSKEPKKEAHVHGDGNRPVLLLVLDEVDSNGEKRLRPIKLREAMRLLGFEGFWVGHFNFQWDAASMEAALQTKLDALGLGRRLHRKVGMGSKSDARPYSVFVTFVKVQEYVYYPGMGEETEHPKLYELVVKKDNVVYRLRVMH